MTRVPAFLKPLLPQIAERAIIHDIEASWPGDDLHDLQAIGAMKWAIGRRWQGYDLDAVTLHDHYEALTTASLATALILSQRDAAVGYIEASTNDQLRDDLLPKLAANQVWTTIGISHLTTSQQSGTLNATPDGDSFVINGTIPWSTGAEKADFIVAAAKTDDGRQVLFVLPTQTPGVSVLPPIPLATLAAAPTTAVTCQNVSILRSQLLAGPVDKALSTRTRSLPLGQTFAALGLTRAALDLIKLIDLPSAQSTHEALEKQLGELSQTVREANTRLEARHDLQSGPLIRSECNNLALRAVHSAVALHRGSALRLDHPAQRLAREAMFLLVWSTPTSVMDRNLELIAESH